MMQNQNELTPAELLDSLLKKREEELTDEEKAVIEMLLRHNMIKMVNIHDQEKKERSKLFKVTHSSEFYDRNGKSISMWQWSSLNYKASYKIIQKDTIGPYFVSTVWLGMNMSIFPGDPIIFETMIFCDSNEDDELANWIDRYSTEEDAIIGHEEACKLCRERI